MVTLPMTWSFCCRSVTMGRCFGSGNSCWRMGCCLHWPGVRCGFADRFNAVNGRVMS